MKITLKKVFESDIWIITKISQGPGVYRIDAKRRFPVDDKSSFFSNWGSQGYLNNLARENYGKNCNEFSIYKY